MYLRDFQLVSSYNSASSLTSSFLLGQNPFSHYLNNTTLRKLCQALFYVSTSNFFCQAFIYPLTILHSIYNTVSRDCQELSELFLIFFWCVWKKICVTANFNPLNYTFILAFLIYGYKWVYMGYYGYILPHSPLTHEFPCDINTHNYLYGEFGCPFRSMFIS